MTVSMGTNDLGRFRALIAGRLGLQFDDSKLEWLVEVFERRAETTGSAPAAYLDRLERDEPARDELRELARQLTVAETYFFRHAEQFQAFTDVALPDRLSARAATRQLRILSAGCASGEEAYSLAILVRQRCLGSEWEVFIRAADINQAMLEKAAAGRYSAWALRETPEEIRRRWFVREGREFSLERDVQRAVSFEEHNLALEDPDLWPRGGYDVVFCRNLMMYFTVESAQMLVARIARALAPGGYLFLGHAETLRGLSHDFHLRHTHDTFYYQRKDGVERAPVVAASSGGWRGAPSPLAADGEWATTWIETVRRSAERIEELTERAPTPEAASSFSPGTTVRTGGELGMALDLLKKERFAEALELLGTLAPDAGRDPDALLLHAVLLMHGGHVAAAEKVCARLLEMDELCAGARYVLALCRESVGDLQGARNHDQVAAYLDPTFSMPRLHLGLLARRAGELEVAQRELGQAVLLLQREDASRLLLFGGGFGRDGLIALCRAELGRLRGKP